MYELRQRIERKKRTTLTNFFNFNLNDLIDRNEINGIFANSEPGLSAVPQQNEISHWYRFGNH